MDPSTLLSPASITSYDTPLTPAIPRNRSLSPNPNRPALDLNLLLRPGLYNPIPTNNIPPPFLHSSHQPAPDTPLPQLLQTGHFRLAAERAADTLSSSEVSPFDIPRVLDLFYTRLACLVLVSHATLAAKEARTLLDILARETGNASHSQPGSRAGSRERPPLDRIAILALIPWPLRLLLERLKTVLTNDARRGIMNLYQLGAECRAQFSRARKEGDEEGMRVWRERLADLGVRVAGELVGMGEFDTAGRHLSMLDDGLVVEDGVSADEGDGGGRERIAMAVRKALLYLRIGDVDTARECYTDLVSTSTTDSSPPLDLEVLRVLTFMAEADYVSPVELLERLLTLHPSNELLRHNLAVCLLYNGDVQRANSLLEGMVGKADGAAASSEDDAVSGESPVFSALLFNLATIYELRTEKARERKVKLVERVADRKVADNVAGVGGEGRNGVAGYERLGLEFKL